MTIIMILIFLNGLLIYLRAHQYNKQLLLKKAMLHYQRVGHLEDDELIKEWFSYHHSVNITECYSLSDVKRMLLLQDEINERGLQYKQEEYLHCVA